MERSPSPWLILLAWIVLEHQCDKSWCTWQFIKFWKWFCMQGQDPGQESRALFWSGEYMLSNKYHKVLLAVVTSCAPWDFIYLLLCSIPLTCNDSNIQNMSPGLKGEHTLPKKFHKVLEAVVTSCAPWDFINELLCTNPVTYNDSNIQNRPNVLW